MHERPMTLMYTTSVQLLSKHEDRSTLEEALDFIRLYIEESYTLSIPAQAFNAYGKYGLDDKNVYASIASVEVSLTCKHWSIKLSVNDPGVSRRKWITHIHMKTGEDNLVTLNYALFYSDTLIGRMTSMPSPQRTTPSFITYIMDNDMLECIIGAYQLPVNAMELNGSTWNAFEEMLNEKSRQAHVIVITCPDLIDPEAIAYHTLGNSVVFYVSDPEEIFTANDQLPPQYRLAFDSMHIIGPWKDDDCRVNVYGADLIIRRGANMVYDIRQALCEGMTNERYRQFMSNNDIMQMRQDNRRTDLEKQIAQLAKIQVENELLRKALADCEALVQRDWMSELDEYDKALSSSLETNKNIRKQLEQVIVSLFSKIPVELPNEPVIAEIGLLIKALQSLKHSYAS